MEFSMAYLSGKGNRAAGMRLLVARCEGRYTGRLTAVLPEAVRLLILNQLSVVQFLDGYGSN
jgi:RecB family endonuclease NucS